MAVLAISFWMLMRRLRMEPMMVMMEEVVLVVVMEQTVAVTEIDSGGEYNYDDVDDWSEEDVQSDGDEGDERMSGRVGLEASIHGLREIELNQMSLTSTSARCY
eukprot:TRINITY_DN10490_c0_g1_i2.p1 TRINITY_DN10490_c0_g1~~TRINITY_DN10490_c0_g1_i2.p1  ORF type:complete len:104 (+),score=25.73 TRINITY_DN10490_c0_g1_i2:58-369(+)